MTFTTDYFLVVPVWAWVIIYVVLAAGIAAIITGFVLMSKYRKCAGAMVAKIPHIRANAAWDDQGHEDERPESVRVGIVRDGTRYLTILLTAENDWKAQFETLPDARYDFEAVAPEGYEIAYGRTTGRHGWPVFTAELTYVGGAEKAPAPAPKPVPAPKPAPAPRTVDVTVAVTWLDENDKDGTRPDSVRVRMIKNEETVEEIDLSSANIWTCVRTGLEPGEYLVEEIEVPEGYDVSYTVFSEGNVVSLVVTNTLLTVTKPEAEVPVEEDLEGEEGSDAEEEETIEISKELEDLLDEASKRGKSIYHITHRKFNGKWQVRVTHEETAMAFFSTQAEAIQYATTAVKITGGRIVLHNEKGAFMKLKHEGD